MNIKKLKLSITTSRFFPLIERMFSYPMERREFQKKNGYRLKLKNPQTMNEKIVVKKVRDRNPLLPLTADKFHVKGLLRQTFGTVWTEQHIIPTLDYGTQFKTVSLADLPEEFIVKGTHLSGRNLIKTRVSNITQIELDNHIKKILRSRQDYNNEWLYSKIQPGFIIEPLLRDESNNIPKDFKFICIHGKVQLIQIFSNRHDGITRSLFDINGNYIESRSMFKPGPNILPIYNLNEIIEFVETLTFNLDFVRVDIYIIKNRPLFGELTHYPGSGHSPMDYNLDLSLGRLWT